MKNLGNGGKKFFGNRLVLGILLVSLLPLSVFAEELPPGVPSEEGYRIDFVAGWNMFSVPVAGESGSARIAESTCRDSKLYHYDALRERYVSRGKLSEGAVLPSREGFWNNQPSACYVVVEGDEGVLLRGTTLWTGWNQIGGPRNATSFSEVAGNCDVESGPYWYNPSESRWVKSGTLEPGKGYFVKVSESCVLGPGEPPLPPECKPLKDQFYLDTKNFVGESITAPNGYSIRLMDISGTGYGQNDTYMASFNIYDDRGALVDSVILGECETYNHESGISIRVLGVRQNQFLQMVAVTSYGYSGGATPTPTATPSPTPTSTPSPTPSPSPFVKSFYDLVITPEHPSCPETIRVFDANERWRFHGIQQGQNLIHLETEDMFAGISDRDFNDVVFTTAVANNDGGAQTLTVSLEGCDTAAKDGIRVDLGFATPKIMKLMETGEVQSGLNGSFQLWSDCHGHVGESKTIKITDERTPPLEIIHVNDLANNISTYSPGCTATMPYPFNQVTYFYRQVRNCVDGSVLHNQLVYTDGNYCNFKCENRYREQCVNDGSFDTYYDERCPQID